MSVLIFCALHSSAQAQQTYLKSGETLQSNGYLVSADKSFYAILRTYYAGKWNGGFTVHKGPGPGQDFGQLWSIGKESSSTNLMTLSMQADGNLCVYQVGSGAAFWCKNFVAQPIGPYFTVMQNDGNLCIYKGSPGAQGAGVWCSMAQATAVTWRSDGKQYSFLPAGQSVSEVLVRSGTAIGSTRDLKDSGSRWSTTTDGTLSWSADNGQCMTVNADKTVNVQGCNGSAAQTGGWSLASDRTLRKGGTDGCFDWVYDSSNWRDGAMMPKTAGWAMPCAGHTTFTMKDTLYP
jgi:hypothetical protein